MEKRIILALCIVMALMIIGIWVLSVMIYKKNFNTRFTSYEPLRLYIDDFDGLRRTQYRFSSNKGQVLTGYLYSAGENQRGIVVMAHGFGGGGHNSYMDCANYFSHHGYYVFAYDGTGNDESEGETVGGLPQGVIDLNCAIAFMEKSGNFPDLPIVLFGHSWGGYSACSVLAYHPEVKAVIACSGFNSSSDMFKAAGKKQVGNIICVLMPFVKLYERIKYGNYASSTAMNGFSTAAAVMIVHSSDDNVVPAEYGYDIYYEKYKEDPRFRFIRFENRGHNYVYTDAAYINKFTTELDKWSETLDYDRNAAENRKRFESDKADYIHGHLDRDKWCNALDVDLFDKFVKFYDDNLEHK